MKKKLFGGDRLNYSIILHWNHFFFFSFHAKISVFNQGLFMKCQNIGNVGIHVMWLWCHFDYIFFFKLAGSTSCVGHRFWSSRLWESSFIFQQTHHLKQTAYQVMIHHRSVNYQKNINKCICSVKIFVYHSYEFQVFFACSLRNYKG